MVIPVEEGWESFTQLPDHEHLAFVVFLALGFWLSCPSREVKEMLLL